MSNGPKELNFQLIKVEMALEKWKKGNCMPGNELSTPSAPTERDIPAGIGA